MHQPSCTISVIAMANESAIHDLYILNCVGFHSIERHEVWMPEQQQQQQLKHFNESVNEEVKKLIFQWIKITFES